LLLLLLLLTARADDGSRSDGGGSGGSCCLAVVATGAVPRLTPLAGRELAVRVSPLAREGRASHDERLLIPLRPPSLSGPAAATAAAAAPWPMLLLFRRNAGASAAGCFLLGSVKRPAPMRGKPAEGPTTTH
jgi:hypothetical protein